VIPVGLAALDPPYYSTLLFDPTITCESKP
jgi:hypothetical protein